MGTVNLSKQTVNLSKNQVINLSKSSEGLKKVLIGLGWDEAKPRVVVDKVEVQPGFLGKLFGSQPKVVERTRTIKSEYDYDLDAWVSFLSNGKSGSLQDTCYFNNLSMRGYNGEYVKHMGDNLTGAGDGDDEQIELDLTKIPDKYNGLVIGVTIYRAPDRKQQFGDIENFFVRVVDENDNFEICRYADTVSDEYKDSYTFIVGKIYKDKGEWQFKSAGYGTRDTDISNAVRNYRG